MVNTGRGNPILASAAVCAALICSGAVRPSERSPYRSLVPRSELLRAEGTVCSNPVKSPGGSYRADFLLESATSKTGETSESSGKISVLFPADIVEAFYPGKVHPRAGQGIVAEAGARLRLSLREAKGGALLVTGAESLGWRSEAARWRGALRLQFKRLMYGWGNAGGLLLALLSGSREYTEADISGAFRNAGLSHILALSGMHLSLFGGVAFFFGKKAAGRKRAGALRLTAIALFVSFAGLSPPLFRALLCALIPSAHSLLRLRKPDGLSVLAASFLIHAAAFPGHLSDAAFLLSYTSLAGMLVLSGAAEKRLAPQLLPRVRASLAESASAQLFAAPVSARLFGRLMPVGIVAAAIVSPLVTVFLYAGLLGIAACLAMPFLSGAFGGMMNALYAAIKAAVLFFARAPGIEVGSR